MLPLSFYMNDIAIYSLLYKRCVYVSAKVLLFSRTIKLLTIYLPINMVFE